MKKLWLLVVYLCLAAGPAFGAAITDLSIGGLRDVLEHGATTEMLVGGGDTGNTPVWTTCTGTGAPVRAVSPALTGTTTVEAMTASGNVTLGDATGDAITLNGQIAADQTYAAGATVHYLISTLSATSGTLNNLRLRAQSSAGSASTSVIRSLYGQAVTPDALYAGTMIGVHGNFIAKTTSTTVTGYGGFFEAETEATPTALTNMYGVYIRTKAHMDPATDYYGLMIDNEKMATGFLTDAYIGLKSTTWAASSATYGIDMNGIVDLDTADIRGHHGEIIYNNPDGGWHFGSADLLTTGNVAGATYGSDGSITNAEFLYINTLSSNAQDQIDGKEGTLTNSAGLLAALSDETGTGLAVFGTGPILTGATLAGTLAAADNIIERAVLKDYGETVSAIGSDTTPELDLENGNVFTDTVDTGETTYTFSNPPASGTAGSFTLILTNPGSQTVNWPAAVDWAGGTAPSLTTAGIDILTFVTIDAGTIWYGFLAGLDMK